MTPLDREAYLDRWAELHGTDPRASALVHGWLRIAHAAGRPLAGRVPADLLTAAGLLVAAAVVPLAAAGGRWPLLAVPVVVLSGLVDSLDGAVAVMTGRESRWGGLLDSVTDRLSDAAYGVALWLLGAPVWLAVTAMGLAFLLEYVRARAGALGLADVGVVTVGERPTRVVVTAMFCLAAGLHPAAAATWATLGALALGGASLVGLAQLLPVVRRRLREGAV